MKLSPIALGVNIDHVATVRQARRTRYPEPILAALLAEQAGADNITLHLREDRRHIQERDVRLLRPLLSTRMNLEMAVSADTLALALEVRPQDCCLVPEKRQELSTEGGLDVIGGEPLIGDACQRLAAAGVRVALFIDPDAAQIQAARVVGAAIVELHTGTYADASGSAQAHELERLRSAARQAAALGMEVHAGHGLTLANVIPVAAIPEIVELNIGHALIAQALFEGLPAAVRAMKALMQSARPA